MPGLSVPAGHVGALEALARLRPRAFSSLKQALDVEVPKGRPDVVERAGGIFAKGTAAEAGQARALIDALTGLQSLRTWRDWSAAEVGELLGGSSSLKLTADQRTTLASRVATLLDLGAVRLLAKATDLLTEAANVYHAARIVTDVRPVYGATITETPVGAVIVHSLKVEHHTDGEVKSFHVAIETSDLKKLHEVVVRALDKASALESWIHATGIQYLDVVGE